MNPILTFHTTLTLAAHTTQVREGEPIRLLQYQAQVIDEIELILPRWGVRGQGLSGSCV
jgi:hypothetical protein